MIRTAIGVGGTLLATGATGYCPAYDLFGVDTTEETTRRQVSVTE